MNELWDNPLYTLEERLEMAIGAIQYRDKIIVNLRQQLDKERSDNAWANDDRQMGSC